jgi:hypothetical protein
MRLSPIIHVTGTLIEYLTVTDAANPGSEATAGGARPGGGLVNGEVAYVPDSDGYAHLNLTEVLPSIDAGAGQYIHWQITGGDEVVQDTFAVGDTVSDVAVKVTKDSSGNYPALTVVAWADSDGDGLRGLTTECALVGDVTPRYKIDSYRMTQVLFEVRSTAGVTFTKSLSTGEIQVNQPPAAGPIPGGGWGPLIAQMVTLFGLGININHIEIKAEFTIPYAEDKVTNGQHRWVQHDPPIITPTADPAPARRGIDFDPCIATYDPLPELPDQARLDMQKVYNQAMYRFSPPGFKTWFKGNMEKRITAFVRKEIPLPADYPLPWIK